MSSISAAAKKPPAPVCSVPEPALTPKEVLRRAASFRMILREKQDEHDALGTYSDELHRQFVKAGFYRITQPRLFGGYEFDIKTLYQMQVEISRGHPAVGWCLGLAASHAFEIASHWPEQGQYELFGKDGHFIAPHRAPPMGTLTPTKGGYIMSGTWDYCSGVPHATHFIGGCLIKREGQAPVVGHGAVPKGKYEIIDDWGGDKTLGMRASGSNSVRVKEVFVPEHHVGYLSPGLGGTPESMEKDTAGTRLHGNPMYLGRLAGPFHVTLVAPIIGAARAALDEYEDIIKTRKTLSMPQIPRFQHFDYQRSFGYALTLTDSAEALMIKVCEMYADYCQRWADDGTLITTEENMRLWGMMQHSGRMASEAVEHLFHTGGSAPARKGHKLQRYFNDVAMYRGHSSSQYLAFESGLARLHFGLPWGMYGL
jgi:3-hydroxy-9,10-secoandrosta-1,3,5(10)-triene-9,17-dione monooxygenase